MLNTKVTLVFLCLLILLPSCADDSETNPLDDFVGTWELSYYETSDNEKIESPNDGKPVVLTLKSNGTYNGSAGNNEIMGEYHIEEGKIILTFYTSEMANTEWEKLFHETLEIMREDNEYVFPYGLEDNDLILSYDLDSSMHFIKHIKG